jgi:hypothetical protein
MGCLTTTQISEKQAELAILESSLDAINTAITSGTLYVESYTLDTGEARQTMKYKSLSELLKARELIQSQVNRLRNILRGTGLMNLNLRRGR